MTFYDSKGRAVAYTEDNENIYLYNGIPVAYLYEDLIYNYRGIQLGRYENGWVRDKSGFCVFFTENSWAIGPTKPIKQIKPIKELKKLRPIKGIKHIAAAKPVDKSSWSHLSGERFFLQ